MTVNKDYINFNFIQIDFTCDFFCKLLI